MRHWLVLAVLAAGCGQEISTDPGNLGTKGDAPTGSTGPDAGVAEPDGAVPSGGSPDARPATNGSPDAGSPTSTAVSLKQCTGHPFPPGKPGKFKHITSDITALTEPEHGGFDVLSAGPGAVTGSAKLQYGAIFKDLEDEEVRVWYHDCDRWVLDGTETTNDDGRISHKFPALAYGVYDVRYEVAGDATTAPAQLWILPKNTHLAVFDIDGTLTTSDFELIKDLFYDLVSGEYEPSAYPGAVDLTQAVRDVGFVGVYLTGRPYWLTRTTKEWLDTEGFAPGPLFLAPTNLDALPTNGGVGDFKLATLKGFQSQTFKVDWAHGNATTDIYAYAGAGVAKATTWIIGKHAGESGTVGMTDGWEPRAVAVEAMPAIMQPFAW